MIKLFLLIMFLFALPCPLKADGAPENDSAFMDLLNKIKDPFISGLPPKPVVIVLPKPAAVVAPAPRPKPVPVAPPAQVYLPSMTLEGIMVGPGIYEAIIDGRVVDKGGFIEGAKVMAVTKTGVRLKYKGKIFFLRVD